MGRGASWSHDDIVRLETWLADGKKMSEIARDTGWSWSSIRKAAKRLRNGVAFNRYNGSAAWLPRLQRWSSSF